MSKRGISPIISVVLLVGFTIALAAIVSTFLIRQTEEAFQPEAIIGESEFCDQVVLGYSIINNPKVKDSSEIPGLTTPKIFENITLKNKGAFTLYQITLSSPGLSNQQVLLPDDKRIKPSGGILELPIAFDADLLNEKPTVSIVPWIKNPRKEELELVVCPDSILIFNLKQICDSSDIICQP